MRLAKLEAFEGEIPLRREVKHASHTRTRNSTLLIRAELDEGSVGWGEGLPRPYVTGETIASCWTTIEQTDFGPLAEPFENLARLVEVSDSWRLPAPPAGFRTCFGNTVRCAVELAVLDAACRAMRLPVARVIDALPELAPLRQEAHTVQYGVALTATSPIKERLRSWAYRLYGFREMKVKVGMPGQDEPASLRRIRAAVGQNVDLRVDANEGWTAQNAEARIAALRSFGITSVEQPLPHDQVAALGPVRAVCGVPIMLDESLCDLHDAHRAIEQGLCDLFNLRISKCGGYLACLRLAAMARRAGLGFQLGCMVGETGILSAAGRQFACSVAGARHLEGSYDRHLVAEPLTVEDVTFRRGGHAPALPGPGLGVTVAPSAVARVTRARRSVFG